MKLDLGQPAILWVWHTGYRHYPTMAPDVPNITPALRSQLMTQLFTPWEMYRQYLLSRSTTMQVRLIPVEVLL